MKILSATQIHEWDKYTIEHDGITSLHLMERAAKTCVHFFIDNFKKEQPVKIFCGKGNNGGDGLAVARLLLQEGFTVNTYILEFGAPGTNDFQSNLQQLHTITTNISFIQHADNLPAINATDIVIDAMFGSGLNRPLKEMAQTLVEHINNAKATVISIDVPSGMYLDKSCVNDAVVKANTTLTFQSKKLCFLMAENAGFFGDIHVLDIGLNKEFLNTIETDLSFTEHTNVKAIYKPRKEFVHKGTYGHALLIAGNTGKMGAAIMSSRACLRAGAGLLTVNVPGNTLNVMHSSLPEAMCAIREDEVDMEKISVVGIGPGIGTGGESFDLLNKVLANFKHPMVIDADALNIIAKNKALLNAVPENSILSPHPKEFERLFGEAANDFDRMQTALVQSARHPFVIILKGTYTLVAYKGKGMFNTTGNAGLAKGGSGDMLTGLLTALLCQKYTAKEAAVLGVYLHGLAADITLQHQSKESMLATDVIENIGNAYKQIALPG